MSTKFSDLGAGTPAADDLVPIVDISDTTMAATGTNKKATVSAVVAAGGAAFLPKTAGSSQGVTGTLYLDPGADDAATVLKVPVTNDDGADVNFVVNKTLFNTTYDTTFNWGFNNSGAGAADATKHAWYLQLEYDFASGGNRYVEYHLNLLPPSGGNPSFRPFQYQYNTDGSDGAIFFNANNFYVQDIGGTQVLQFTTIDATPTFRVNSARLDFRLPNNSAALNMYNASTQAVFSIDGTVSDISFRPRLLTIKNITTGSTWLTVNSSVNTLNIGGLLGRLSVEMPDDSYKGLVIKRASTQTKNLVEIQNNAGAVQFGIDPDGEIWTNQASANTATPSGATAYQLPIYNAAGALLGYIPVYGSAWT